MSPTSLHTFAPRTGAIASPESGNNLEGWQERIGSLCVGNSRLTFAASCAFAGPLLPWAAGPLDGVFHLVGDSSCGKTTALRVAASVWGDGQALQRWPAQGAETERTAVLQRARFLCLDELACVAPQAADEALHSLAGRMVILSAGEIGLAAHIGAGKGRTQGAQVLPMIDLPADAGRACGVFEELHGHKGGGALAQHLARACESTFGAPGVGWLEHLVHYTPGLSPTVRTRLDATERELVPEGAAPHVQRVGRRFALVAVAGAMATDAGLTGWPPGWATQAARQCLDAWIAARAAQ